MRGKRHVAWAGATLALVAIGFGLGRLEAEPAPASAPRTHRNRSPEPSPQLDPSPTPSGARPLAEPSLAASPAEPGQVSLRGARRPGTSPLWAPPLVDPDALRLAQLLHAFRDPARPPESLEGVASTLLSRLQEQEQVALLVALARFQDVGPLCDQYAVSPAALPLLRSLYGAAPSEENRDRLLSALRFQDYEQVDLDLLKVLALDWPEDPRTRDLLQEVRQALAEADASSHADQEDPWEEPRADEPPLPDSDPYAEFEAEPYLEGMVMAYEEDPAGLMAWLAARPGPRWAALALLVRLEASREETLDLEALDRLRAGDWRHLQGGGLLEFARILAERHGSSPESIALERQVMRRLAADGEVDVTDVRSQLGSRGGLLLGLATVERYGWDAAPLSVLQDYLGLLEEEPFVARRLLPELWKARPSPSLAEGLELAGAYQAAGDPGQADEVLRRCQPSPELSAARDHLAGGHSLAQFREWLKHDE
jgi:hypothetical protein